jgi:hypothetical protein
VRLDWQHVILALASAAFILGLGWLALRENTPQLWHVIAVGSLAWITTILALFKRSLRPPQVASATVVNDGEHP